jgi:hypothetical protein
MHLITIGNQSEVSLLSRRLTGRYPVAIVQASSLSHPRLVGLPAYRRVEVFARICGTRTELSPPCEPDSGKAQLDSGRGAIHARSAARPRATPAPTAATVAAVRRATQRPRDSGLSGCTTRVRQASGGRTAGGRHPARPRRSAPVRPRRSHPVRRTVRPSPDPGAVRPIHTSSFILSLFDPRLRPSDSLGVSDMQICYSPTTR